MNKQFLIIYGYGYSGSGAVLDLMKEIEGVNINKSFFSLIKDPYGIINLEDSLVNNWDFVRSDAAIKDYLWLCKKASRGDKNIFARAGLNLKRTLNSHFLEISKEYIDSLINFDYYCWNEIDDFKLSYITNIRKRISRVLKRKLLKKESIDNKMFFSKLEYDYFIQQTQKYIDNLFSYYDDNNLIVLDHHPLPVQFASKLNDYFGSNAKMIVVDRNPKDIYCDLVNHKNRIGRELSYTHDITKYYSWYKALRDNIPISDNILYLQFEDLVNNYENEIKKIFNFLKIDEKKHLQKYKYFNPEISKNNIGIWKKQKNVPSIVFETIDSMFNK